MFSYCVCGLFVVIIGGLVSQTVTTSKMAERSILLNGYLKNDMYVFPVRAVMHNYSLTIQFNNKTSESVSIHVKRRDAIVCLHELNIATKQTIDIDLSSLEEGEYRLDMYNKQTNEHVWGFFFIG